MRLAIDHHYSPVIARHLRDRGHDAVTAADRGWDRLEDEALLAACAAEQRALLTNDVGDFTVISRAWVAEGRHHAGLVFTSDVSISRNRHGIGRLGDALDSLLGAHPADDAFDNRVLWL